MTRKNPRRISARFQKILAVWLDTQSTMRYGSRPSQIRAAAKLMQRSGRVPAPVMAALKGASR